MVVLADVVDGLIERALEEGRVDRDDRPPAAHREAGRHRHRVLLGDADVEEAVGELGLELRSPVPVGMPAVIADDPRGRSCASSISSSTKTAV